MSADRCPRCGTAGPAGSCACPAVSPVEQTAVLPPLDAPPLVRPYVAGTPVADAGDPFATRVVPAVQPITAQLATEQPPFVPPQPSAPGAVPPPVPGRPPHVPQAASPFAPAPAPSDAATQLLPPVPPQGPGRFVQTEQGPPIPLGRVVPPPQPQPEPPTALIPPVPTGPEPATALLPPVPAGPAGPPAPTDLGMFNFHEDEPAGPAGRTERRAQRRRSADRKRLVIAGGAVGVTALAVILAMLLSASPDSVDHALPAPTGLAPSPETTPSAPPSTEPSASADSPSPTRVSARPSQTVTARPTTAPTTPAAQAPPTVAPTTAQPSSSAPSRTLQRNDTGPEVTQLQHLLVTALCYPPNWLKGDLTRDGDPGFGLATQSLLSEFQRRSGLKNTKGVYDERTRAALEAAAQNPDC
ncbi:peptidoglycan-binding domain-containing protein [Kitasatospora sp. NPDC004531]